MKKKSNSYRLAFITITLGQSIKGNLAIELKSVWPFSKSLSLSLLYRKMSNSCVTFLP